MKTKKKMDHSKWDRIEKIVDYIDTELDGGYGGLDMEDILDNFASKYDDVGCLQSDLLEALREVASGLESDMDVIQDALIDIESLRRDIEHDFAR